MFIYRGHSDECDRKRAEKRGDDDDGSEDTRGDLKDDDYVIDGIGLGWEPTELFTGQKRDSHGGGGSSGDIDIWGLIGGSKSKRTDRCELAPEAERFLYKSNSDECDRKRAIETVKRTDRCDLAPEAEMFIYRGHSDECDRKRAEKRGDDNKDDTLSYSDYTMVGFGPPQGRPWE